MANQRFNSLVFFDESIDVRATKARVCESLMEVRKYTEVSCGLH